MTARKNLFVLSIFLVLSACATLNKSECLNADWKIIGLEDGSRGRAVSYIGHHREACAEHGVAPDLDRYRDGHEAAGLTQFCRAEVGFDQGKRGYQYNGVCPAELRGDFLYGYETGRELYLLNRAISQMHAEIKKSKSELESMQNEINQIELKLISMSGSSIERLTLLQDLRELEINYLGLDSKINNLALDAARNQGEYNALDARHES